MTGNQSVQSAELAAVKLMHTLAWFSIESCMVYVLYTGLAGRSGVVAGETLVFAANGFRCPLTTLAENLGAENGSVTDIYLPGWLADNLPAIHVPLIALAVYLHTRNIRRRHLQGRDDLPPGSAISLLGG